MKLTAGCMTVPFNCGFLENTICLEGLRKWENLKGHLF